MSNRNDKSDFPVPEWQMRANDWILHAGAFSCRVFKAKTASASVDDDCGAWNAEMTFGGFTTYSVVLLCGREVVDPGSALQDAHRCFKRWVGNLMAYAPNAFFLLDLMG